MSSGGTNASLAPISIARLHSVIRSETDSDSVPANSTEQYDAPSAVMSPIRRSIRSIGYTPSGSVPSSSMRIDSGTRIHSPPVTHAAVSSE